MTYTLIIMVVVLVVGVALVAWVPMPEITESVYDKLENQDTDVNEKEK